MKKLTLSKQILIVLFSSVGFTVFFSFFFINYLYSELYLTSIEESIVYQGKRTASHYHYGDLNDEIIQKIQWYNIVSEYEIIVVDNLDEDRKSTRLNSSHVAISYAVFCLKKK